MVTARNTSFRFKGESVDIKEVGAKLGVQYILEGSVRRAGNRVRITAQLAECETGNHIWAERYDRELEDIFEQQDEVTKSIVAVLPGRVEMDVADRSLRKPTENMQAYELMMQAKAYRDLLSAEGNIKVRKCCKNALALDPHFARAYMYYSDSCIVDIWWGTADDEGYHLALEYARKAISLDPNDMFIQDHLGFALLSHQKWKEAEAQFDKTLPKITHEAESMAWIGYANLLLDHREKARDIVLEAMQRNPLYRPTLDWVLGQIHFFEERYEDVLKLLIGEALLNALAHGFLAGAYAHLGRKSEATAALDAFIRERHADFATRDIVVKENTIESLAGSFRAMWRNPASWEKLADGLRLAGLKDTDTQPNDPTSHLEADFPDLSLSEKPSIAVLPFENLSSDREQDYFSDGITADIVTALSKIKNLFVVAKSSTAHYRGDSIDLQRIGREQGVRCVLEGSVQKESGRVRVNVQLSDVSTGHHVWAERYDRKLQDIFAVQDNIMREIVVTLDVQLVEGEQARAWSSGTTNFDAWECVRLAAFDAVHVGNPEVKSRAKQRLEKALQLDSNYAIAWVMLGWIYQQYVDVASLATESDSAGSSLESMLDCANKAIAADPDCADA